MNAFVVTAGFQTTVQDCGRIGFRKFGVPVCGALDVTSLRLVNLVVGNDECAAGLEVGSGRLRLRVGDDRLIAWSGGEFDVRSGENEIPSLHCARLSADTTLEITPKSAGRAWVAISGGIDVPKTLGSRSTDLRSGFGGFSGRALRDGDELPLGEETPITSRIATELKTCVANWGGPRLELQRERLRVIPGRSWDELGESARAAFVAEPFQVALNSDRMGMRLEGAHLQSLDRELVSEAVTPGTIQLPRGGAPIVLLADCQTIGGYPKIAHVIAVDLSSAAQLQPLDSVGFDLVPLQRAQELLATRERDIALFRAGLEARFA